MNKTIETKVIIYLNLIKSGKTPDEAAVLCGHKSYDAMRASIGIEGGCSLKDSIERGEPVEWTRKKFVGGHKKCDCQTEALRKDYDLLLEKYKALNDEHKILSIDHDYIVDQYKALNDEHKALVDKYNSLVNGVITLINHYSLEYTYQGDDE